MTEAPHRIKLHHNIITRAPGLLPMLYRVSDLADDLGIPAKAVRNLLNAGAPHQHDQRGHLWVSGTDFAHWVSFIQETKRKRRLKLQDDEAFCLGCRRPVKLIDPEVTKVGHSTLLSSICPACGSMIYRGAKLD